MNQNIAARIDHTNLKPEADASAIDQLVREAIEHQFASVCVNGRFTERVVAALAGTSVATCVVAGFPLGAMKPTVRNIEATAACKDGATEIDFVAHLPHLINKDLGAAREEFRELVRTVRSVNPKVIVKVILETATLMQDVDDGEAAQRIEVGCLAARESGCDFVKTSTGFHAAGGATMDAVRLLKQHAGPLKIKAAGGIRTSEDAQRMIDAGADRLGCSAGVQIVQGASAERGDY